MADLTAILAHKHFEYPNNIYFNFDDVKVYSEKKVKTNFPVTKKYKVEGYTDKLYGEYPLWQYLYDKENKYEWYTLEHYRRHLVNMYHQLSVAQPIRFNCSLLQQTCACHSFKLTELFKAILEPQDFNILSSINYLIPYNIMHVHRSILEQWLQYVKPRIDKCTQVIGINDYDKMVEQMKVDNTFTSNILPNGQINEGKNCDAKYQARLYSFVLERLHTIFWAKMIAGGVPVYYCEAELLENGQRI